METCITVPAGLCCLQVPPALSCLTVPSALCCFTVPRKDQSNMAYMSSSASNCCLPCTTCCIGTCSKRPNDRKPITLKWAEAVGCTIDGAVMTGGWTISSVAYTITAKDGTALAANPANLIVAIGADLLPMQKVYRKDLTSRVVVALGAADTDYRLTALATFSDCDGLEIQIEACVIVSVEDC